MATPSTSDNTEPRIESPCIRICTLNDDDVCLGCYRDIAEICAWSQASNEERRAILNACDLRRRDLSRDD